MEAAKIIRIQLELFRQKHLLIPLQPSGSDRYCRANSQAVGLSVAVEYIAEPPGGVATLWYGGSARGAQNIGICPALFVLSNGW